METRKLSFSIPLFKVLRSLIERRSSSKLLIGLLNYILGLVAFKLDVSPLTYDILSCILILARYCSFIPSLA